MKISPAQLRQQLWRLYQALNPTLRAMTPRQPMTPGSFYLMRRKCGKPSCRCLRGHLHPAWVLTRSEAGRHKLYSVPPDQRPLLRQWTTAWRRYQHARARFGKQTAALLALADQLARLQTVAWPKNQKTKRPS